MIEVPIPFPWRLGVLAAAFILVPLSAEAQEPPPEVAPVPAAPPHETPLLARAAAPYVPPATTPEPVGGFGANLSVGFSFISTPPDLTLTTPDGGAMKQFNGFPVRHLAATEMVDLSISVFYRTIAPSPETGC